ncbi:MAG: hypothetical protein RR554_09105 [Vagococcus sp.]|uniref:hypothetical protein n=1 Tax=Vagococcus sp. TaxID=1933889 RepID=UPI002FC80800
MEEYLGMVSHYEAQKKYEKKTIIFSIALIVGASLFVWIDSIRVNPLVIFALAMGLAFFYAIKGKVVSKNYDKVYDYLKKSEPEIIKNKELVCFIDYKLSQEFKDEPDKLINFLKAKEVDNSFKESINQIKQRYDLLVSEGEQ